MTRQGTGGSSRATTVLWLAAALLALSAVLIVNGRPLFYYDTVGYFDQGTVALQQLGLAEAPAAADPGAAAATGAKLPGPRTVDGSRSPFYSFLAGALARLGAFEGLLLFNAAALGLSLWLMARILRRTIAPWAETVVLACLPLIAGALGSLPFYAAYLMPDLLAPVLLLNLAILAAFARQMTNGERLAAVLLGSVATVSHLSHLGIAAAMVPAVAIVSVVVARRRWWLAPALALAIVAAGYGHQALFRLMAEKAADSDVIIKPFITARMIQDGPGYDWLEANCPESAAPTCALWDALQLSDDPYRLTATHIVFETSKRLGSFRLMSPEDQKAVADGQVAFFLDVLKDDPAGVAAAFVRNTLIQSAMVSVDMTLPNDAIVKRNDRIEGTIWDLHHGWLSSSKSWVDRLLRLHQAYYAVSLVAVGVLLLAQGTPRLLRAFGVALILGILANAFVCGGISQPATRYGARVIWLLPMLAALMLYIAARAPEGGPE